jgi:predicted Zn-dependent protease
MKIHGALPILPILIAGWAGLSCADISSPSRSEAYEWRRITVTGPGTSDTLSFHWPRSRLPVKIWAEDTFGLPSHVQNGIEQWRAAFLYGEFDAVLVSDSTTADVVVQAGTFAKSASAVFRLESSMAPECTGSTNFDLVSNQEVTPPIRVFVNPRFDPSTPGVSECLGLTTTHELGHAIGILEHSPNADDIMFSDPSVAVISPRDRATAERAYHIEPTLTVGTR